MSTLAFKTPPEAKNYTFDLTSWLNDMVATISSVTSVVADGAGLVVDEFSNTTLKITAKLSAGTAGTTYRVRATFQADGQVLTADIWVPVANVKG